MTGISYPERAAGRHVDTSSAAGWLTRHINPAGFLQWMLVICLALFLWPATFGGRFGMVIVAGTSMEPTYQLGDAVITWKDPVAVEWTPSRTQAFTNQQSHLQMIPRFARPWSNTVQ